MDYKLENMGNAVKIGETVIPAVNIQVDNVPGFIEDCDGGATWYGIYFEILFENGDLWEVSKGATVEEWDDPTITAVVTEEYGRVQIPEDREMSEVSWRSWSEFLDSYNVMCRVK